MKLPWQNVLKLAILWACAALWEAQPGCTLAAVPDKLVVLTFDDSVASQYSVVRPSLKRYGLDYLHRNGYRVIALRDLAKFVDPSARPADPMAVIEKRKSAATTATLVRGEILDAQSRQPLASRLYIRGENGVWYFP